jgi:chromatin structure-remodeling complex subunit RSC3/30
MPSSTGNSTTPFPRSEVIQNLSVFASLLETALHIRDGNYGIARRGLDAIRNILDRVLSGDDCDEQQHQSSRHHSQREKTQQQQQQEPYKIIPDPAMACFASPSADQLAIDPTIQQQQEISASQQQQQQQPSIMMPEDASIPASYTAASSTNLEKLGTDGSYNTNDNFLPLDFMSWLDSFDWAQESLLNYS